MSAARCVLAFCILALVLTVCIPADADEQFCGLVVEPEYRCSEYDRRRDYTYPRTIERDIARVAGYQVDTEGNIIPAFPSRYMPDLHFTSVLATDIEHIVAAAEAHDSGLCRADRDTRRRFARDLDNLTLAHPQVNRWQKSDKDAGEWLPRVNQTWYATTIVLVKRKYGLSIDAQERDALAGILGPTCTEEQQ